MARLLVENVSLQFETRGQPPVTALQDISISVGDGELAVIVGPSGCGKSSLLHLVAGLIQTTSGEVYLDGEHVSEPGKDRGMVFQAYTLFPWLTVQKNVEFGPNLRGVAAAERAEIARYYIKEVALNGFENAYPAQLSGGMMQRAALARALANDPKVLLMDEPFGALDSQTRSVMQQLLLQVWEHSQKTVLFVTHDIEEALFLGGRVYVMTARPGQIKEEITVPIPRPRTADVVNSNEFVELKRRVTELLHDEVLASMDIDDSAHQQAGS